MLVKGKVYVTMLLSHLILTSLRTVGGGPLLKVLLQKAGQLAAIRIQPRLIRPAQRVSNQCSQDGV